MAKSTILTCAVTGNLTQPDMNEHLPITPRQIADSALEAAEAGAAAVHIHVRDPLTGAPSMDLAHYKACVDRIRDVNSALIINLTTGPGGRFQPSDEDPKVAGPRTNLTHAWRRVEHVTALRPDVASLDLNTMTFGREVVINTPQSVRDMAAAMYEAGVMPELELFDTGDIGLAKDLFAEGALRTPAVASLVLGIKYGMPATPEAMLFARSQLPDGTVGVSHGRPILASGRQRADRHGGHGAPQPGPQMPEQCRAGGKGALDRRKSRWDAGDSRRSALTPGPSPDECVQVNTMRKSCRDCRR
jgi:uncharacterized protein (DUF849 family)